MRYPGSKKRIFKWIKPFLQQHVSLAECYYEPFVGGANSLVQFDWHDIERYAWDINPFIVDMWNELRLGWEPPKFVTMEQYEHIKQNLELYEPWLVGYVGIIYACGGTWFSKYCGDPDTDKFNFSKVAQNAIIQAHKLRDVKFENRDFFRDWATIKPKSIVYCDPPYRRDGYRYLQKTEKYDYDVYRQLSRLSFVYVSEGVDTMPADFGKLFERQIIHTNKGKTYIKTECLYSYVEGLAWNNQSVIAKIQSEALI